MPWTHLKAQVEFFPFTTATDTSFQQLCWWQSQCTSAFCACCLLHWAVSGHCRLNDACKCRIKADPSTRSVHRLVDAILVGKQSFWFKSAPMFQITSPAPMPNVSTCSCEKSFCQWDNAGGSTLILILCVSCTFCTKTFLHLVLPPGVMDLSEAGFAAC